MGTWWWLALGAVAALSLLAAVIDGGGRLGGRRRATPGTGPDSGTEPGAEPGVGPCPGEIWWTREPLLVLVLAVRGDATRVVPVTAELPPGEGESEGAPEGPKGKPPGAAARGRIVLPPGTVRDAPGTVTALRPDGTRDVPPDVFATRAGEVDPETWDRVRHLAGG